MQQLSYEFFQDFNRLKRHMEEQETLVPQLQQTLAEARQRIAKLELTVEALVELQERTGVGREQLALLIQQLDLADGYEDGQMGPDRSAEAVPCGQCGRPLNLQRDRCIYCGTAIDPSMKRQPQARMVECVQCQARVAEQDTFFGDKGVVCSRCFYAG